MTESGQKKENNRSIAKRRIIGAVAILLVALGIVIMLLPTLSEFFINASHSKDISRYSENVGAIEDSEYEKIIEDARAYNRELFSRGIIREMSDDDMTEYMSRLNMLSGGMMGYIEIGKIGVRLPIYHDADAEILQKNIGHVEGTSLPVGMTPEDIAEGYGSHSMLSGHRGLPSARLFTDLDKLEIGDSFTLTIGTEVLVYRIDDIQTVLPEEVSSLIQIKEGEDRCTLMTCTPYGINTHRLLVSGVRNWENGNAEETGIPGGIHWYYFIAPVVTVILTLWLILLKRKRSDNR